MSDKFLINKNATRNLEEQHTKYLIGLVNSIRNQDLHRLSESYALIHDKAVVILLERGIEI